MKKLLLHICCGPCGTHPATLLSTDYEVIGYFYNPNIWPYEEWGRRYEAFKKFCKENGAVKDFFPKNPITPEEYLSEHKKFLEAVRGLEKEPEGGARCLVCFKVRLDEAARFARLSFAEQNLGGFAKEIGADIFATTLTIGRNKRPEIINPIGVAAALRQSSGSSSVKFYDANFKKQDGALKGKKIADEYGLYRQHYCGCEFSL